MGHGAWIQIHEVLFVAKRWQQQLFTKSTKSTFFLAFLSSCPLWVLALFLERVLEDFYRFRSRTRFRMQHIGNKLPEADRVVISRQSAHPARPITHLQNVA